ncbi:MAG: hypothetical protein PHY43_08310 [Verrucomicrobiales bacterium]|nr:hypothetical protein [Verrucomicrobiales bacterium]
MIATETATRYNREPSKVLGQVERGQTVLIEKHGFPTAAMIPMPQMTSGAAIARRMEHLKPAPEAADAMEKILKRMDDASRKSFNLG